MDRRSFFKAILLKGRVPESGLIRPPYNNDSTAFLRCISCQGPCIEACESKIISFSSYNTPYIDFSVGACTFCDKCWEACEKGVLEEGAPSKIQARVEINRDICISWNKVECTICKSSCPDKSILFYNMRNPYIDDSTCTGCGFCLPSCPDKAISILNI